MSEQYDAIVIGTGLAGLGASALLARAGKKVLALEKHRYIGGRTASFDHQGYIMNIGQHAGLEGQKIDQLFARVGKKPGAREYFNEIVVFRRGEFIPLVDLTPLGDPELIKFIEEVHRLTPEDFEKLDAISGEEFFAKWLKNQDTTNLLRLNGVIMTTIPWLKDMAASSAAEAIRTVFRSTDTWLASHGMGDFLRILVEVVRENGGDVKAGAPVTKILVEGNRACGVIVEEEEEAVFEGELGEAKRIEAPIVIAAFPIWDLFKVTDSSLFSREFIDKVMHLDKRTANIGITAGMKEPLYEDKKFIINEFPRAGYPGTVFMPTNVVPTIAPEGAHLLDSSIICEYDVGRDREQLFKKLEAMKEDVEEMFPGWQKKCEWIKPYFHWEEPARNPGREGVFRPGPKAPGIEGLFFAGDTVSSRALPGMECACDSAMICVQEILGELPDAS